MLAPEADGAPVTPTAPKVLALLEGLGAMVAKEGLAFFLPSAPRLPFVGVAGGHANTWVLVAISPPPPPLPATPPSSPASWT